MESQCDTEYKVRYLITILLHTNLLLYIAFHVGHLSHHAYDKDAPLHTFLIFIAVSKRT